MTVPTPSPAPRCRRRSVVTVVAAAAIALLAGCTPAQAGSAAIVGDVTLTQAQLGEYLQEIMDIAHDNDLTAPDPASANLQLVGTWVEETLTEQLAEREGVTVPDGDVDDFLAQFGDHQLAQIAVSSSIGPSTLRRAARTQLLQVKLGAELAPEGNAQAQNAALRAAFSDLADEVGVSVNPRFGTFHEETAQVGPRDPERLSSPAAGDTPSPDASQG